MEFIVGIYLKVCTWLYPQKTPPRGQGGTICPQRWTFIVYNSGHMSHDEGLLVIMLSKMAIHKTNRLLRRCRGAGNLLLLRLWKESKIISRTKEKNQASSFEFFLFFTCYINKKWLEMYYLKHTGYVLN